jgi:DNA mismatch repair protein MutL
VRSGTVVAAVEQAYKNSAMVGKFPAFVLYVNVPFDMVDVNVHPAKTEVRFSDEKRVFDSVYATVKNALSMGDIRPEIKFSQPTFNRFERMTTEEFRQTVIKTEPQVAQNHVINEYKPPITEVKMSETPQRFVFHSDEKPTFVDNISFVDKAGNKTEPIFVTNKEKNFQSDKNTEELVEQTPVITVIGQCFNTYIVAQMGDSVFMIDKHAAHERILFNTYKEQQGVEVQALLTPVVVNLQKDEYNAVINNLDLLLLAGFEADDFGASSVAVRAVREAT